MSAFKIRYFSEPEGRIKRMNGFGFTSFYDIMRHTIEISKEKNLSTKEL